MISAQSLCKSYAGRNVIQNLSFSLKSGETISFFGANGCGKSTALRILAGLEQADSGTIIVPKTVQQETAFVFQDYRSSMLPWRSSKDNILLPLEIRRVDRKKREQALAELLKFAPISFDLDTPVYELSGGQAQLVALLRAAITKPRLLLLDEPSSAFDQFMRQELLLFLQQLRHTLDLSIVSIFHDLHDALSISDRLILFKQSKVGKEYVEFACHQQGQALEDIHQEAFRLAGLQPLASSPTQKVKKLAE